MATVRESSESESSVERRVCPEEFDHFDPAIADDPYPAYAELRARCPIGKSEKYGGFYYLSTFDDVWYAYHHPELFSSYPNAIPAAGEEGQGSTGSVGAMIPLEVDPPDHGVYRRLLDPLFAPKVIAALEAGMREDVIHRIGGFVERGSCEFVEEFAVPVPCKVFLDMMGMPVAMLDQFCVWKDQIIHAKGASPGDTEAQNAVRMKAGAEMSAYYAELIDERTESRGEDAISYLLHDARKRDGESLTPLEVLNICSLFFIAGLDTVTSVLGNAFVFLARSPQHRRMIVENPAIIPSAIEEFLRYDSPIQPGRTITRDFDYKGVSFKAGDRVMLLDGSASRDSSAFDNPDTVRFDRSPNRHVAFGVGPHRCMGSHLARLELRIVFEEWHRRIPDYHITAGQHVIRHTAMVRGVDHLPLTLTP